MSLTTDPKDSRLTHGPDEEPGPQAEVYLVLSPEERAKGFTRFVRRSYIHDIDSCGVITRMGQDLAETYARDPKFYGSTYCVGCRGHHLVGEFIWLDDGETVGS